jgi:hypothetical protein
MPGSWGTPMLLSSVSCTGDETSLAGCRHLGWGHVAAQCSHSYDVGVRCLACDEEHCRVDASTVRLKEPFTVSDPLCVPLPVANAAQLACGSYGGRTVVDHPTGPRCDRGRFLQQRHRW